MNKTCVEILILILSATPLAFSADKIDRVKPALDILRLYEQNKPDMSKFGFRVKSYHKSSTNQDDGSVYKFEINLDIFIRKLGDVYEIIENSKGKDLSSGEPMNCVDNITISNGKDLLEATWQQYIGQPKNDLLWPYMGRIHKNEKNKRIKGLLRNSAKSFLDGNDWCLKYTNLLDALLINPKLIGDEKVNGHECKKIRTESKYGIVTAWFAPKLDYSMVKYTTIIGPDNFGGTDKSYRGIMKKAKKEVDILDFVQVDGKYVPCLGTQKSKMDFAASYKARQDNEYFLKAERSEITFNPDLKDLGTYKLEALEGALININGEEGDYMIKKGVLQPITPEERKQAIRPTVGQKMPSTIKDMYDKSYAEKKTINIAAENKSVKGPKEAPNSNIPEQAPPKQFTVILVVSFFILMLALFLGLHNSRKKQSK